MQEWELGSGITLVIAQPYNGAVIAGMENLDINFQKTFK